MGGGELSDKVCESVGAQASFKCGMWRHFGSPMSRNEKGENVKMKNSMQTPVDDGAFCIYNNI